MKIEVVCLIVKMPGHFLLKGRLTDETLISLKILYQMKYLTLAILFLGCHALIDFVLNTLPLFHIMKVTCNTSYLLYIWITSSYLV